MAKIFTADNPGNPIRLVRIANYNPAIYWSKHFDDDLSENLIQNYKTLACYTQKYNKTDKPVIQILSDYETFSVELYDINDQAVKIYVPVLVNTNIIDFTFKCYETEINFTGLDNGVYQLRVSYVDDEEGLVKFYSEPIKIKEVHEGTILVEYTNSENNFGFIFSNNWTGKIRVESEISNFMPASDDVIYIDQKYNNTRLYGQPYRKFQFILGCKQGVPDWMVDKINRAFCFDQLSLDGEFFNKTEEAQWEETRVDNYPFTGQVIDIMPVENKFADKIKTDDLIPDNPDDIMMILKKKSYLGTSEDLSIPGVLKNGIVLDRIFIVKRSVNDINLVIETTPDSGNGYVNENVLIDSALTTVVINQAFKGDVTLNLTGLTGVDVDIWITYLDLLATSSGSPNPYVALGKGAVVIYEETSVGGRLIDFNFETGLGREDTEWFGWAICDGRNGTQQRGGLFPIGWKATEGTESRWNVLNSIGGSFLFKLLVANLPKFRVKLFSNVVNNTGGDIPSATSFVARGASGSNSIAYELRRSVVEATLGQSSEVGGDQDTEHVSPYIVSLFVKKIADI